MIKKILLITLGFSLAAGGFWSGLAQDPAPQNPSSVRTDPPTVAAQSTPTDLSGTYAGTFNCDALGLTGDTTLTINGNEFTLADGRTGRLVASTTKGYTAVALQLARADTATTPTAGAATAPSVVSLRAKKSGTRLTLSPASGSQMKCSFVTRKTSAATGTEVSNPATPTESPVTTQTPAPSPPASPTPTPDPTPVPNPSPSPTTTPTPVPSPGEPTPSPTASPTPTPSPSPF